jgi:hypothetical protein
MVCFQSNDTVGGGFRARQADSTRPTMVLLPMCLANLWPLSLAAQGGWQNAMVGGGERQAQGPVPLRCVLPGQVAAPPANLAPMAKAFSQSAGNTVR